MNTAVLVKAAKVLGYLLPVVGGVAAAWANNEESKKAVVKTTEKLFNEHIKKK